MIMNYLLDKKNELILVFTIAYLAAFTINAFVWGNFEFLYYTILMIALIYFVLILNKSIHLGFFITFSLSVLGFLHLLGGNLYFGTIRLYDWYIIPGIFRYDNFIHSLGTFITTIALYSLVSGYVHLRLRRRYAAFAIMLVLMAIGLGSIVELVESVAVVVFGAAERVGGYFNNALDLWFNTIGSILATIIIYFYIHRPKFIQRINGAPKTNN
ncbi:MAG: hypothetical protein RB292_03655 [Patescibacteria group bacterium]|nr:hypothetical protein [Patescibacteria group bacterium]